MKKVLFACAAVSLLIACSKKDIQKWLNKPGNPKPSVPCKIDSIYPVKTGDRMFNTSLAVGIHYNNQGNPIVLNYHLMAFSPHPERFSAYYKYDNKNRLIEVNPSIFADPVDMDSEFISEVQPHKFVYQGNSPLPIRDSILSDTFFGVTDGISYKIFTVRVDDYSYDSYGRINRVVTRRQFTNTFYSQVENLNYEVKFSYDSKGNRQVVLDQYGHTPAAVSYNDKPSLFSLHPVWQLIHKNWSKNAVAEDVETYNSNGLPTKAILNATLFLRTRSLDTSNNSYLKINYTCL
jgi:hypothetical protein